MTTLPAYKLRPAHPHRGRFEQLLLEIVGTARDVQPSMELLIRGHGSGESSLTTLEVGLESPQRRRAGNETLLLVDDDDGVRRIARLVLERNGYRVIEANCGASALEASAGCGHFIDLLITDIMMPGMNGLQVADQLLARHPHLKVLFSSGYIQDEIVSHSVLEGENFLPKPFTPNTLIETVRTVLDR